MKSKKFLFTVVALAVCAAAVWFLLIGGTDRGEIRNVVLISIDTCRADRLSCYGYPRKTTPNIDVLAKEGILFENVISPIPLTLPSHCSMLTGTTPVYHGVHDNQGYRLSEKDVTLAEILKEKGFRTGAVISAFVLDSCFGLGQGFDTYDDQFDEEFNALGIVERRGLETSQHANTWLENNKDEPFFLFLHYFDPHRLWEAPEPFASQYMTDPYAGEISYVDYCIGQVIDKLKSLGLYDSTLIIVTADHGEGLMEHGESTHGYFIYQGTVKVPLIFKVPGISGGIRITDTAGLVDIVPTVCSLLNIQQPDRIQGRDLCRYFSNNGKSENETVYFCESLLPTVYNCNPIIGIVKGYWKYIKSSDLELYDLSKDPGEHNNLINQLPQRRRIMDDHLKIILENDVRPDKGDSKLTLDQETRKRLESLGYVGSSTINESFEFDEKKENPKDLISFHGLNCKANNFLATKEFSRAKEVCRNMLEIRPEFPRTYKYLGSIAYEEGDNQKADYYFSKYLEFDPDSYEIYNDLGLALLRQGDIDKALIKLEKAIELKPDFSEGYYNLGTAYAYQRKLDEAVHNWNKALILNYYDPATVHVNLAEALIFQGKIDQAIYHWDEALETDPDNTKIMVDLAGALIKKGKLNDAQGHLMKSLDINPNQPVCCNIIAELLYTQGNTADSMMYWQRALTLQPDWPSVLNNLAWIMAVHRDKNIRNPAQAVKYAQKACILTDYKNPESLDTLSAAFAAAGQFENAIETAHKAKILLLKPDQQGKVNDINERIKLFEAGRPYQE